MALGLEFDNKKLHRISDEILKHHRPLLLCGHRGCGKSTELTVLAQRIKEAKIDYLPIFVNIEQDLNLNNIEFSDIFILILEQVHQFLAENSEIEIDKTMVIALKELHRLVADITIIDKKEHSYNADAGINFDLFIKVRGSFKNHASTTTTIRRNIVTKFTDLAQKFNLLMKIIQVQTKKTPLFIVDGSDKLKLKDAEAIFSDNANLITQLDGLFVYAAPIALSLIRHSASLLGINFLVNFPHRINNSVATPVL